MKDKTKKKDLGNGVKVRVCKEGTTTDGGWFWRFEWYSVEDRQWSENTPLLTQAQIATFALWLCMPGNPGSPYR